jgi:flavin-dependent dehydrogenase
LRTLPAAAAALAPSAPIYAWLAAARTVLCVVLAGDAAGVVAPASGEGIYYAMLGGQLAAEAHQLAK